VGVETNLTAFTGDGAKVDAVGDVVTNNTKLLTGRQLHLRRAYYIRKRHNIKQYSKSNSKFQNNLMKYATKVHMNKSHKSLRKRDNE